MQIDTSWLIGLGGIVAALLAIRSRNRVVAEAEDKERRMDAIKDAQEARDEVGAVDDDGLDDLGSRWVRRK